MKTNGESKSAVSKVARTKALFEEFPWLKEHFSHMRISRVDVREINSDALDTDCGYTRNAYGRRITKTILIFTKNGELLGQVGMKVTRPKNPHYKKTIWDRLRGINPGDGDFDLFPETVASALLRLPATAHYIVGTFVDSAGGGSRLIFTQPQKGLPLEQSIKNEVAAARAEIVKELNS